MTKTEEIVIPMSFDMENVLVIQDDEIIDQYTRSTQKEKQAAEWSEEEHSNNSYKWKEIINGTYKTRSLENGLQIIQSTDINDEESTTYINDAINELNPDIPIKSIIIRDKIFNENSLEVSSQYSPKLKRMEISTSMIHDTESAKNILLHELAHIKWSTYTPKEQRLLTKYFNMVDELTPYMNQKLLHPSNDVMEKELEQFIENRKKLLKEYEKIEDLTEKEKKEREIEFHDGVIRELNEEKTIPQSYIAEEIHSELIKGINQSNDMLLDKKVLRKLISIYEQIFGEKPTISEDDT